jgi:hypothetical protein
LEPPESGTKPVKTTPEMDAIELPPTLKMFLQTVGNQLVDFDREHRKYTVKPLPAFAACLAVVGNDARRATQLLNMLLTGIDEWNVVLDESPTRDFPVP